jgi:hypothetical protein
MKDTMFLVAVDPQFKDRTRIRVTVEMDLGTVLFERIDEDYVLRTKGDVDFFFLDELKAQADDPAYLKALAAVTDGQEVWACLAGSEDKEPEKITLGLVRDNKTNGKRIPLSKAITFQSNFHRVIHEEDEQ